ncbi:hypothetical protein DSM3645_07675 [Blastopirellula marina DSM 3645]|uniref:Uncharacterized protein n=1 Tax=Blastopirellula marina DSM 3645 TaxID=314230 RepID=A3ZXV0_9BACT|nr:hypothetical protein DSM3645_07675 [Blastopirellula marina DSM 3645]
MTNNDTNPYASPREVRSHAEVQSPVSGAPQPLRIWLWWSARRGIIGGVVAGCFLFLVGVVVSVIRNEWSVVGEMFTGWSHLRSVFQVFLLGVLFGGAVFGAIAFFLGLIAYGLQKFRYREWMLFLLCLILPTLPMLTMVIFSIVAGETINDGLGLISLFAIFLISVGVGISIFSRITGTLFRSRDSTVLIHSQESSSS